MRRENLLSRPSSHPFLRLRALGTALLPLVLAVALPACGVHECFGGPWLPAPALTVADGVVYARGAGDIADLRAGAGSIAWRSTTDNLLYQARPTPPVVADGVVIASTAFGALIARRVSDGSLAWRSQATPRPWSQQTNRLPIPQVADGVVYAAASPDSIAAWRVADGKLLWQSPLIPGSADSTYGSSYRQPQEPEPVVAANVVYFMTGPFVCAVRATDGSILWSALIPHVLTMPLAQTTDPSTPPVLADGRLYIVATDGSLYALDAATGARLWRTPDPDMASSPNTYPSPAGFAPPIVSDGIVYYTPPDGIRALAADTGHLLWRLPTEESRQTALAVAGGVAYIVSNIALRSLTSTGQSFTSMGGALLALNARTGAVKWQGAIEPGKTITTVALLVNGDAVYTISTEDGDTVYNPTPGVVSAWSTSTGARLWQRTLQSLSPDLQPLIFADGVIYLSTDGVPKPACGGIRVQPAISALRASDGALLWQTSVPAA